MSPSPQSLGDHTWEPFKTCNTSAGLLISLLPHTQNAMSSPSLSPESSATLFFLPSFNRNKLSHWHSHTGALLCHHLCLVALSSRCKMLLESSNVSPSRVAVALGSRIQKALLTVCSQAPGSRRITPLCVNIAVAGSTFWHEEKEDKCYQSPQSHRNPASNCTS